MLREIRWLLWEKQIQARVAQVHTSTPEGGKKTRTSRVGIAQRQQRREIRVQGQGVFESLISAADRETFNGSRSEFWVSLMSCCAMKKQGHFDRYHEVTPITTASSSPVSISRKHIIYSNAEPTTKIRFPHKDDNRKNLEFSYIITFSRRIIFNIKKKLHKKFFYFH